MKSTYFIFFVFRDFKIKLAGIRAAAEKAFPGVLSLRDVQRLYECWQFCVFLELLLEAMFPDAHVLHSKSLNVGFLFQSKSVQFRHGLTSVRVLGLFPVYWETYFTTMKDATMIFVGRVGGFAVAI